MKVIPKRIDDLSDQALEAIMKRSMEDISGIYEDVRTIVEDVKKNGITSLLEMSKEFKIDVTEFDLEVTPDEINEAYNKTESEIVDCLKKAAKNIKRFHEAQIEREMWSIQVSEGILAGRMARPIDRVGCYIPGGRAIYPSTILMTVLPAKTAGVQEVIATTPPQKDMSISPVTLVAADIAGCDRIFKIGGPWGISALSYGTGQIPRVDKIVGPGNKYVTAAKMIVYGQVDIDSPAGPSEALILTDDTGDPEIIALDFLSQVEHDPDAAAVLVTLSPALAEGVSHVIEREFDTLPRKDIIETALAKHSHILIAKDLEQAVEFSNTYAPEHLQILTRDPFMTLNKIRHAGSVFLGPNAPVPVGDYASGPNHVLPTGQGARMFSGLSVDDFIKKPTFQYLDKRGLADLRKVVTTLAEVEGLPLHARAVEARFK
jgi:histidinol dehydrogenase